MSRSSTAEVVMGRKSVAVADVKKYDVLASYKQRATVHGVYTHASGNVYFDTDFGFIIPKTPTVFLENGEQIEAKAGAMVTVFLEDALQLVRAEGGDEDRNHCRLAVFNGHEIIIVAKDSYDEVIEKYVRVSQPGRIPFPEDYESEDGI